MQKDFKRTIHLNIRRYDLSENPEILKKTIEVSSYIDCNNLKGELQKLFNINDEKVIKIRNGDGALVPISFLLDSKDNSFFIDITNVSYIDPHYVGNMQISNLCQYDRSGCSEVLPSTLDKNCASLLQDAYVDAVKQKIRTLESRIAQSELLLPQLEWRRQAYMEDTVSGLTNKVAFLNRRFDELSPQFMAKFPETIS